MERVLGAKLVAYLKIEENIFIVGDRLHVNMGYYTPSF
jgi:hypothetical protein